jgi:predicted RND superfamily exporter protein
MVLLLILFAQDIFFSFKRQIAIFSPLFYTISFLLFLFIFSVHCNIYLDIMTVVYNVFLFIVSSFIYNKYERINDTKQDTCNDYPHVEIKRFTRKHPQTVYYQAIDEI